QVLAVASGAVLLLVSVFFTLSLVAVPALPHFPGLGAEVRRAVRPALPRRPARARLLAERERRDLMKQIAKDEHGRPSRRRPAAPAPPAGQSPVITPRSTRAGRSRESTPCAPTPTISPTSSRCGCGSIPKARDSTPRTGT